MAIRSEGFIPVIIGKGKYGPVVDTLAQEKVWVTSGNTMTFTSSINEEILYSIKNLLSKFDEVRAISPNHKGEYHAIYIFHTELKDNKKDMEKFFQIEIEVMDKYPSHLFGFYYYPYEKINTEFVNIPRKSRELIFIRG